MRLLFDTNAYTQLENGHAGVERLVDDAAKIFISTVMLGELLHGFRHGSRFAQNMAKLERFLAAPRVSVVDVSQTTADRYGRITTALRRKGKPIPTNDIWIAAHALETGADLVSFDGHFEHIDGLAWVNPSSVVTARTE